jgi:hypothetical protein
MPQATSRVPYGARAPRRAAGSRERRSVLRPTMVASVAPRSAWRPCMTILGRITVLPACPPRSPRSNASPATSPGPGTRRRARSSRRSTATCGSASATTRSPSCATSTRPSSTPRPKTPLTWPGSTRSSAARRGPRRPRLVRGRGRQRRPLRLLLRRVRLARVGRAVLRRPRHPRGRPHQGRQRPRRPAGGGRPLVPGGVLPPARGADGRQEAVYGRTSPDDQPLEAVVDDAGTPVRCGCGCSDATWSSAPGARGSGASRSCCSTSTCPENHPDDRALLARLYGGDQRTRIAQEMVLGIARRAHAARPRASRPPPGT